MQISSSAVDVNQSLHMQNWLPFSPTMSTTKGGTNSILMLQLPLPCIFTNIVFNLGLQEFGVEVLRVSLA